ncbi:MULTISPECIES: hypothetical protein [unclassified Streptomyces]
MPRGISSGSSASLDIGYGNTAATGWAPELTAQWNSTDNLVITD